MTLDDLTLEERRHLYRSLKAGEDSLDGYPYIRLVDEDTFLGLAPEPRPLRIGGFRKFVEKVYDYFLRS